MPRLLLLEDDALILTLLVILFETAGYDVWTAMPEDCLATCAAVQPEIIVVGCDNRGTFDRGWQLAPLLRQALPTSAMIMLSTNPAAVQEAGHSSRGRLFDAGVRKPFAVEALLATVVACYEARSRQLQAQTAWSDASSALVHPL